MKVKELAEILIQLDVKFQIKTFKSMDEEVSDVDIWSEDFFSKGWEEEDEENKF